MNVLIDKSPVPTVLPTDQARQGVTGHNVRYVLGFGLAGAVIGHRGDWSADRSRLVRRAVVIGQTAPKR
jgi:hypothetical protein